MRVFSILQKLNSFEKIKQKTLKNGILEAIVALGYIGYNPIYNSTMEILDADKPDKDKNKRFDAVNVLERFLETEKRHIEEIKSELERISKEDGDSMVEERAKLILERMKKS